MSLNVQECLRGNVVPINQLQSFIVEIEGKEKQLVEVMARLFNTKKHCWMKYRIQKKSLLGYHHIEKTIGDIDYSIPNLQRTGALITTIAQKDLQYIKVLEPGLYEEINYYLEIANDYGHQFPGSVFPTDLSKSMSGAIQRMHQRLDIAPETRFGRKK